MSLDTEDTTQLFTGFRAVHVSWLPHSHPGFVAHTSVRTGSFAGGVDGSRRSVVEVGEARETALQRYDLG